MTETFSHFAVFAEMRTGSNFLETNLNAIPGVTCHGEAFNPYFIGYPNSTEILGVTQAEREADPARLIATIRDRSDGLGGFRYFHDHDPRVLDLIVDDPRCAKIILTRNPVDSFVSWKIAQQTGQWKLTDVKRRKDGAIRFDAQEFTSHLTALQAFQVSLLNRLQRSGQTAFYIAYEDLHDLDVMNGLARFLGVSGRLEKLDTKLKVQNPQPLSAKVENFDEMEQALARLDAFNLTRTPNFEPRRNAAVPSYVIARTAPLMYLPVRSGPEARVCRWLAGLDGIAPDDLVTGVSQKALRQWKRKTVPHRSFTVLRHPVARAHHAFCTRILSDGPGSYPEIRRTLRKIYKLDIPGGGVNAAYDTHAHRTAFLQFLRWLQSNLQAQTGIRVDPHWASQAQVLSGFDQFALPDMIAREDTLEADLAHLAHAVGLADAPPPVPVDEALPFDLGQIYDDEVEEAAQNAYARDYMIFGFGPWR